MSLAALPRFHPLFEPNPARLTAVSVEVNLNHSTSTCVRQVSCPALKLWAGYLSTWMKTSSQLFNTLVWHQNCVQPPNSKYFSIKWLASKRQQRGTSFKDSTRCCKRLQSPGVRTWLAVSSALGLAAALLHLGKKHDFTTPTSWRSP